MDRSLVEGLPMKFEFNEKVYSLEFQRNHRPVHVRDATAPHVVHVTSSTHPFTSAKIFEVDKEKKPSDWKIFMTATVGCAPDDKFTLEGGRIRALRKIGLKLEKGMRASMWGAYMSRHRASHAI